MFKKIFVALMATVFSLLAQAVSFLFIMLILSILVTRVDSSRIMTSILLGIRTLMHPRWVTMPNTPFTSK
jgi:hypothetical protein